jgi:beta-glucanase (GH16 family)
MNRPLSRRSFLAAAALLPAARLTGVSAADDRRPPACPLGGDWRFAADFSDEFDGPQLDAAKWWDFNPAWHGRQPAHFDRANVRVAGGALHLTARVPDPATVTVEDRVRGYDRFTTAIVKSKRRLRYGYFEARCRSMRANVCNAFWLYDPLDPPAKYREGEASEEIDIFEVFGQPPRPEHQRMFFATVHRYLTPYVESLVNAQKTALPNPSVKRKVPFDFWADFHVYALQWTPQELTWYLDGQEVFTRPNDHFHRPLHVVFDAEVMEKWTGLPDPSDLPATFSIDYVRIWQRAELS